MSLSQYTFVEYGFKYRRNKKREDYRIFSKNAKIVTIHSRQTDGQHFNGKSVIINCVLPLLKVKNRLSKIRDKIIREQF